jgi:hypothetical protein
MIPIVCSYVNDWRSVVLMGAVSKNWKLGVSMYAGINLVMDRGQYRGKSIYKLLVYYPSYMLYMHLTCKLRYLVKIMAITQSRCDKRYIRVPFGKYKGKLLRTMFYKYKEYLRDYCKDKYVRQALSTEYRQGLDYRCII